MVKESIVNSLTMLQAYLNHTRAIKIQLYRAIISNFEMANWQISFLYCPTKFGRARYEKWSP
jgi:hypothetical protein